MENDWLDGENAHIYHTYTQNFDMYHKLARKLLELASLRQGMSVLDVACGTGVVTGHVLQQLAGSGEVIGIDISEAMLDIARSNCSSVRFFAVPAEHVHELFPTSSFDVALCNSAFCLMSCTDALHSLYQVLKPGGRFLFNLPDFIFAAPEERSSLVPLLELISQVGREEYGYEPVRPSRPLLDDASIQKMLAEANFTCIKCEDGYVSELPAAGAYAIWKVPFMTSMFYPDLSYQQRMALLDKAYEQADKLVTQTTRWRYYLVQK